MSCCGYSDDSRAVINVLSGVLGEGSCSRLFQTVREKNGICYQLNSFLSSFYDISFFGIYFSTNEKFFEKLLALIFNEFKNLRNNKITEKELNRAKEYLKASMLFGLESTTNRMFRMAQSEIYFDRVKTVDEAVEEIDEVTSEDILEMSNLLLDESKLSKIILKSKNGLVKTAA